MIGRDQLDALCGMRFSVLIAAILSTSADGQARPIPRLITPPAVVFNLSVRGEGAWIEPIVLYSRGTFTEPPVSPEASDQSRFIAMYFEPGRRYRMMESGQDIGVASVTQHEEPACVQLNAAVTVTTTVEQTRDTYDAIAIDALPTSPRVAPRRAPTSDERAAFLRQARSAYVAERVPATIIRTMKIVDLTAVDLDADGRVELVGSVQSRSPASAGDAYNLFLIVPADSQPSGSGTAATRAALTWFHRGADLEYADQRYLDHVDFDGDGIAEVIVRGQSYESHSYVIYQRRSGIWRQVYAGGGGWC